MDFLDPVDVLKLWPADVKSGIDSKKWSERRDALQSLFDLIEANPKLAPEADYSGIVGQLKMILLKDANINVAALAAKVMGGLARGLQDGFGRFVPGVAPAIFEKFKEKKEVLKRPLIECADYVSSTAPPEKLVPAAKDVLQKPNPNVKVELGHLFYRILKRFDRANAPRDFIKEVAPILTKHADEGDPEVRESAFAALGGIMRLLGEPGIKALASGVFEDKIKFAKVTGYCEKATAEVAEERQAAQINGVSTGAVASGDTTDENAAQAAGGDATPVDVDPWELLDPVDIVSKLSSDYETKLASKKWSDRKEAVDEFVELTEKHGRLVPDLSLYKPHVTQLKKILEKDVNINVCASVAKVFTGLARGLRGDFGCFAETVLTAAFEKFKEKKATLREPLLECVDQISLTTKLESYLQPLTEAMSKTNPQIRAQSTLFLARLLLKHAAGTIPVKDIKELSLPLTKLSGDGDAEVREAVYSVIAAVVRCVGEQAATQLFSAVFADSIKKAKVDEAIKKLSETPSTAVVPNPAIVKLYGVKAVAAPKPAPSKPVAATPKRPVTSSAPIRRPPTSTTARPATATPAKPTTAPSKAAPAPPQNLRRSLPASQATPAVSSRPVTTASSIQRTTRPKVASSGYGVRSTAAPATKPAAPASRPATATSGLTRLKSATNGFGPTKQLPGTPLRRQYTPTSSRPGTPQSSRPPSPSSNRGGINFTELCSDVTETLFPNSDRPLRLEENIYWRGFETPSPRQIQDFGRQLSGVSAPDFAKLALHSDFNANLRVTQVLTMVLEAESQRIFDNADIVLKWMALKLHSNNPTLLAALLELALHFVNAANDFPGFTLNATEISTFLPAVLLKLCDQKPMMTALASAVVNALPPLIPDATIIQTLAEGSVSNNKKQRIVFLNQIQEFLKVHPNALKQPPASSAFVTTISKPLLAAATEKDIPLNRAAQNALTELARHLGATRMEPLIRSLPPVMGGMVSAAAGLKAGGSGIPRPGSAIPRPATGSRLPLFKKS